MRGLVLANIDYLGHTSSEGQQLQAGLELAGWTLAGVGYGDGCCDVPALLERHQPDVVFVQDVRDWLPASTISFRKDVGFDRVDVLGDSGIPAFTVLKDAWGWPDIQAELCEQIKAAGIVTYYRHDMVRTVAPWTERYPLLRMYHSVDAEEIRRLMPASRARKRGIVTGNDSPVYPLRTMARRHLDALGLDTRKHPGYHNRGSDTPAYLRQIAGYKVHLACASQWGAAFRKIIESVAIGCTPVTDLPASDVLPEIDGALVRVPVDIEPRDLKRVIDDAEAAWDMDERMAWAERALAFYDYTAAGARLSGMLEQWKSQIEDSSENSANHAVTSVV